MTALHPSTLKSMALPLLASVTVTVSLFLIMAFMIERASHSTEENERNRLADIVMPEREIDTRYKQHKPEKPEVTDPPPEIEPLEFQPPEVENEPVKVEVPQIRLNNQPTLGLSGGEGDYLPIVKVQPVYPRKALQRGISGYVIVEFTVTKNGSVKDVVVVEAEPEGMFNRAAIRAAQKFKYKPRVVDGEAIEVAGVQNKISFQISEDKR